MARAIPCTSPDSSLWLLAPKRAELANPSPGGLSGLDCVADTSSSLGLWRLAEPGAEGNRRIGGLVGADVSVRGLACLRSRKTSSLSLEGVACKPCIRTGRWQVFGLPGVPDSNGPGSYQPSLPRSLRTQCR